MDIGIVIKVACLYIVVAACETLNGIARTLFLNRWIGFKKAKRVSMISALLLCLLVCYFYIPILNIRTDSGLLILGISLSLFMLLFDITVGRYVAKTSWGLIIDDFNILKGNLLGVGMVAMAFCPLLSSRLAN